MIRYADTLFLPRIWQLRLSVTAYDAAYLALAERIEAPLLTRDAAWHDSRGITPESS